MCWIALVNATVARLRCSFPSISIIKHPLVHLKLIIAIWIRQLCIHQLVVLSEEVLEPFSLRGSSKSASCASLTSYAVQTLTEEHRHYPVYAVKRYTVEK